MGKSSTLGYSGMFHSRLQAELPGRTLHPHGSISLTCINFIGNGNNLNLAFAVSLCKKYYTAKIIPVAENQVMNSCNGEADAGHPTQHFPGANPPQVSLVTALMKTQDAPLQQTLSYYGFSRT